jgi:hypothetical protein
LSHDIIIHCNGVGPVTQQDTITIPHYENGIAIVAWEVPHDMPANKRAKHDARIEKLRHKILQEIAKATGGEITYPPAPA